MDQCNAYTVTWETRPSPGATFYSGARRVYAENDNQADSRGRREIARDLMLSPSSIRILSITRQVRS
jgi:hypothetical protein